LDACFKKNTIQIFKEARFNSSFLLASLVQIQNETTTLGRNGNIGITDR
jgi:hypothetical protein